MHDLLNAILNFHLTTTQGTVLAYIGGSTVIASIIQYIKHHYIKNPAEAKNLITFLVGMLSLVSAAADYIIQSNGQILSVIGVSNIGKSSAYLLSLSVLVHRFAVSPLNKSLQQGYENFVTKAATKAANRVTVTGQITPHSDLAPTESSLQDSL